MEAPKINFLSHQKNKAEEKKRIFPKILFYPLTFIILFILIFSFQVILSGDSFIGSLEKINIFNYYSLIPGQDKMLRGEDQDRINILLLGIGGEGHPGANLTDTIILVSIKPSTNQVALTSIPRDLSIPIPGYGWHKINYANHFGELQASGQGPEFAAEVISKVFDLPIDYYARVDFAGFIKVIDELGGVKINVDNAFTDYEFPTDDYGFQTVSFKQGWQKMDGQTALNFARSRHGNNKESSDFARSKRQQKVLQAIKDEALSFTTFLSYRKITTLLDFYKDHVNTNLQPWEIFKLAKIAKKIDKTKIKNLVLENGPDDPLYATNINGAYLLFPKDMSFSRIQQMFKYVFDPEKEAEEKVTVEIQNGTKIEGLAYRTSVDLKKLGYEVTKYSNAQKQDFQQTIIYDLTNGQKNEALQNLKTKLNATLEFPKPDWLSIDTNPDFIIILGQNQDSLTKLK